MIFVMMGSGGSNPSCGTNFSRRAHGTLAMDEGPRVSFPEFGRQLEQALDRFERQITVRFAMMMIVWVAAVYAIVKLM
jgi:hypothetical protein